MPTPTHLIVIGTAAGGMSALVQHFAPESNGQQLLDRLARHTELRCHLPIDGETIEAGTLYLVPPDRHLLAKDGRVGYLLVTKGPRENHYRPAADALFRSAAITYGPCVVGVVRTGMLHDGTAGLEFIKRCDGVAVVQDPHGAEYPSMPETALRNVDIDYVVPLAQMGLLLDEITRNPIPIGTISIPEDLKQEATIAERAVGNTDAIAQIGHQVPLTCPDCGGSLWEVNEGRLLRFRCRAGRAYTADGRLHDSQQALKETL